MSNGAGDDDSITATVTVVLPQGLLVLDGFDGIQGTPLTAHVPDVNVIDQPWALNGGAPAPTLVTGGVGVTPGPGHLQVTINSGAPDIAMGVDYRVGTGPGLGALVFRLTDASNFLLLETYSNTLHLYKCQTSGCLALVSQPLPAALVPGSTHRLEVRTFGSTIEGWWDGVRRLQTTDTFQQTATRHGLDWNSAFDATSVYDNFELSVHGSALMGPTIGIQPQSRVIAAGQAATLNVGATGTPALTYQWYTGTSGTTTTPIAGATASSYTTPPLTSTTSYWVRVTNSVGVADSATATVTIGVGPTITTPPQNQTINAGQTATLTVAASGTAPFTYQWYLGASGATTTPIAGATADSYTTPALMATQSYWVRVANGAGSDDSIAATVTVNLPTGLLVQDTFSGTPGTLLTSHSPDVNVTGHPWTMNGGAPTPTLVAGGVGVTPGPGHLQVTIDSGVADVNMQVDYRDGNEPRLAALVFRLTNSDNFLLLETYASRLYLYKRQGGEWLELGSRALPPPMAPGGSHRLTVRTLGSTIQGAWDGVTLQITESFQQTATRHGLDWNSAYDPGVVYDDFKLYVNEPLPAPPEITVQPQSQLIASGQTATVAVTVTGTAPLTYQWYLGASGTTTSPLVGATASTYVTPPLTSTTSYWVRVTNSVGSADSATATVTIGVGPTITTPPQSQTINAGQTATLTVAASGTAPFTYQWYQGSSGATTAPIAGATANIYTTPALTATQSYWVRVANGAGTDDSSTAIVTVNLPTGLLVQDSFSGTPGTLLTSHSPDVNVTGNSWTMNGGAPTPTLVAGGVGVTPGPGHLRVTIDSGAADVVMGVDYRVGSGPGMGAIVFRLTDANNFFLIETYLNELQLYRNQAGTYTKLASQPLPAALVMASMHRLEVRTLGSTLEGWWDGVRLLQATDTFQQTATRHGLDWNSGFDATSVYSNFQLSVNGPAAPSAPAIPGSPSPANGATGVPAIATLTWSAAGATTYDVSYGTSNPPPPAAIGLTSASYSPPANIAGTTYFWQVIAHNATGTTPGPVWSYTAASAPSGLLVQDSFIGSPGTLLTTHAPDVNVTGSVWTLKGGSPTPMLVSGGVGVTPGPGHLQVTLNIGLGNIVMGTDYRAGTGPGMGALVFRLQDANNFLLLETYANTLYLYKRQGGAWVALASQPLPAPIAMNSTHRLEVRTLGSAIEGWWDGMLLLQATETFLQTNYEHGLDWNSAFDPTSVYSNFQLSVNGPAAPSAPATPGSPSPANGATGVATSAMLTWSAAGATSYDVAFGTSNPPATAVTGLPSASYSPPAMITSTTYFWQVTARNALGVTPGPVWLFTTSAATAPPGLLVQDTFAGTVGTLLTAHAPDVNLTGNAWTLNGGAPTPTLVAGGGVGVTAGPGHLQVTINSGVANIAMGADYRVGAGPGMGGLVFRLTDPDNFLLLETYANALHLYKRQSAMWIELASQPLPAGFVMGSTHRLEVRASGSTIEGWWDGVRLLQVTDLFQQTATRHGFDWNSAFDATSVYANFQLSISP